MLKLKKPALAGVATAMAAIFCTGALPLRADALALAVFNPPTQTRPALPPEKVAALSTHDVIVFIDSSRSMSRTVGPEKRWYSPAAMAAFPAGVSEKQSRWQWCSEQTENLSKDLRDVLKDQLKVVLFSDNYKVYKDVDLGRVPQFFTANTPYGNTNATKALRSQLKSYFAARDSGQAVKPLLVAMITDGCPDEPFLLRQTIIEATQKMRDPGEISITFLQVGVDPGATKYLRELDECLVGSKAKYDIVSSKSFNQLSNSGLSMALLDAVSGTPKLSLSSVGESR